MQLFISSCYIQKEDNIIINDERIIHQCVHVLRYKTWQTIQLQDKCTRYTLSIVFISKKEIQTIIINKDIFTNKNLPITILIALPNRRDKAELITQKCTEIGIDNIIFWKAERSIIKELPYKKLQRLESIACESSEQSFRRSLPKITYLDNLLKSDILLWDYIILFNQNGWDIKSVNISKDLSLTAIIWPEGWFSDNEIRKIAEIPNSINISLWKTILRMETAAIIWSRLLKNNF